MKPTGKNNPEKDQTDSEKLSYDGDIDLNDGMPKEFVVPVRI